LTTCYSAWADTAMASNNAGKHSLKRGAMTNT
jgi:hypothetical protein